MAQAMDQMSDFGVLDRFLHLPVDRSIVDYVWIDGTGEGLRFKTRVLRAVPRDHTDLPEWAFAGSGTGQATTVESEVLLRPVAMFRDPFRPQGQNFLALCTCHLPDGQPAAFNFRPYVEPIFDAARDLQPWFGIEQEYTLYATKDRILGWPPAGVPAAQGPYYCGLGADVAFGRHVVEAHMRACLFAGLEISGVNGEVAPGQWEYQVGPLEGIAAADQLWMSRFILHRVCEQFGVRASFHPKPVPDWAGSGAHHNFSTAAMRQRDGGYDAILEAIRRLQPKHTEHMRVYGTDNHLRLTGSNDTANMETFSYGVANRAASVRIPHKTHVDGCGYLEDRRPASNVDPYLSTGMLLSTACDLPGGDKLPALLEQARQKRKPAQAAGA